MAERNLIDAFIEPFERVGSASRMTLMAGLGADYNIDNVLDALKGKREAVSAKDFKNFIETQAGIDLTFGDDPNNESTLESIGNFATNFTIDLFTSPDTYLGAPLKALSASKYIGPAAAKGIVGATMGALNIDPDDDFGDSIRKIATGATAGVALNAGLRKGGQLVKNQFLSGADKTIQGFYPRTFESLRKAGNELTPSQAMEINNKSNVSQYARRYFKLNKEVTDKLYQDVLEQTGSVDEATNALGSFRAILGEGESNVVKMRNLVKTAIKANGTQAQNQAFAELRDAVTKEVGETQADEFIQGVVERIPSIVDDIDANRLSTEFSNELFTAKIDDAGKLIQGSDMIVDVVNKRVPKSDIRASMLEAINTYTSTQESLVKTYNDIQRDVMAKLVKSGGKTLEEGAEELRKITFSPIKFHTVDFKQVEELMPASFDGSFGTVRVGAREKLSPKVVATLEGLTEDDILKIGTERYAALFLSEQEKKARQLMGALAKARQLPEGAAARRLKLYDDFLSLQKAVWLGGGFSWLINTLPENIMKAHIASGPKAMLKTLGNGLGAGLYAAGNISEVNKAKGLTGLWRKIARLYDPKAKGVKIDAKDPWLNTAQDMRVVDSTFIQEAQRGIDEGTDLLQLTSTSYNTEDIANMVREMSTNKNMLERGATAMWSTPMAKFTTAFENAARLTTFKEIFKNEIKHSFDNASDISRALKLDPQEILTSSPARLSGPRGEFWRTSLRALQEAAKKTTDTFYDYGNVNAFEKYVAKRFIPFYNFISKDVDFWSRAVFENPRVGVIESFTQQMGREPTEEEKRRLPQYMLDRATRVTPQGKFVSTPSLPLQSATEVLQELNPFSDTEANISGRIAPLPRAIYQSIANRDSFGRPIRPTADKPVTRIQESSFTGMPDAALEALGIKRDARDGRLYTASTATAVGNQLLTNVLPVDLPAIRQVVSQPKMESRFRDKGFTEALIDQMSPVKEAFLTQEQLQNNLERRERSDRIIESGQITPSERSNRGRGRTRRRRRRRR